MWNVNILTLFPEIFPGPLGYSLTGKALKSKIWNLNVKNIREYSKNLHKSVDSPPYGGGGGMILRCDVVGDAIEKFFLPSGNKIIYLSPKGICYNQNIAVQLSNEPGINILCGRFEGIDERIIKEYKIQEISMGDFVLSSGDTAAILLLDSCVRLLPGVLSNKDSVTEESFGLSEMFCNLLEYPHYTRPYAWKGHKVPDVLLSGNHSKITSWRLKEAKQITKKNRPDLWLNHLGGKNK